MLPLLFPPLLISDWSRGRRQHDESPQDLSRTHTNTLHPHINRSATQQVQTNRAPKCEGHGGRQSARKTHMHTLTHVHTHTHFYWLMCEEISGNSQIWGHTGTSSDCRLCVCLNLEDAVMTARLNHSKSVCTSSHH